MMTSKYRVCVGSNNHQPWTKWTREDLEYSARELGFGESFIEELSNQELFSKIISEGCRQAEKEE
ncbi:hypothetical protein NVP1187O_030 [Vibrio phage 1.187.O._10N.286.49.F1]|nr:hypothetical protein NVP1187O_030 [Vibrio phage 1.187.O._10N.286.49.F1]